MLRRLETKKDRGFSYSIGLHNYTTTQLRSQTAKQPNSQAVDLLNVFTFAHCRR
ncbi:hypothetical protein PP707_05270 [Acetobacter pasteurianus]|nr:hypothetical protein [Acetobacter pasteurianus]